MRPGELGGVCRNRLGHFWVFLGSFSGGWQTMQVTYVFLGRIEYPGRSSPSRTALARRRARRLPQLPATSGRHQQKAAAALISHHAEESQLTSREQFLSHNSCTSCRWSHKIVSVMSHKN